MKKIALILVLLFVAISSVSARPIKFNMKGLKKIKYPLSGAMVRQLSRTYITSRTNGSCYDYSNNYPHYSTPQVADSSSTTTKASKNDLYLSQSSGLSTTVLLSMGGLFIICVLSLVISTWYDDRNKSGVSSSETHTYSDMDFKRMIVLADGAGVMILNP